MRVLITGTTSGLGEALAKLYSQAGSEVICVHRSERRGQSFPLICRNEFLDITSASEVEALFKKLQFEGKSPNLLLLIAGINERDNHAKFEHFSFEKVLKTNLFGVSTFISALQTLKLKRTKVVTISSMSAVFPNPENIAYYISKFGLLKMVGFLAATDRQNEYKTVVLGPVASRMTSDDSHLSPAKKWLFKHLLESPQNAARRVQKFVDSNQQVLYWPLRSLIVYRAVGALTSLLSFLPRKPSAPEKQVQNEERVGL